MDCFEEFFKYRAQLERIGLWVNYEMYRECAKQLGYIIPSYNTTTYIHLEPVIESLWRIAIGVEISLLHNKNEFISFLKKEIVSTCKKIQV